MKNKTIFWLVVLVAFAATTPLIYKKFFVKVKKLPYITKKPERRTIRKIIDTTGKVSIADKIKKGSLVAGIVKKLHVNENDVVKKGDLLVEIDTGKDDTEVREAEGALAKAKANYRYQKNYYLRQKGLYQAGQLARNEFESIQRDYRSSKADLISARARYDKAKQEYDNTKVYAPQDGVVILVGVSEGERVTTDLDATVLFSIAKDIRKMRGSLEINESNIGHIKVGQEVEFTVDSFPHKKFKTKIKGISYSPKKKAGNLYYKAIIDIDNTEELLRPGLSLNAKIFVAKAKKTLALTSQAFMVSSKIIVEIAKSLGYSYHAVDKKTYKTKVKRSDQPTQTVWTVQRNGEPHTFVEKIVTTNLTDDIYFEITSGLSENDDVIVDVEESNYMEEIYKKAFGNNF